MPDKVQTAITWLKWLAQIIGAVLALVGGGQVVQMASAPDAYASSENLTSSGATTISGILTMILAPAIAKGVSAFWAWKRGKGATPVLDYGFALGCVANLREYLTAVPAATAPLDALKALVVKVEADRVDPPEPAPGPVNPLVVEGK